MPTTKTTFGIDLGTTHSCVAYIDSTGKPVIVRSAIGEDTTPSVVYFEGPEQALVGSAAKNSAILAPHLVAELVKREMGGQSKPRRYFSRDYSPEEISALVLKELARCARQTTGTAVGDVVITVPAYFGVAEREATKRAGEIAGLTVLDVIAEPVAAALHYEASDTGAGVRHLLVCDLGGGTFDTTVIRLEGDDIRVVCTDGDRGLGGADWDVRVRDHLVEEFTRQHPRLDPSADDHFRQEAAISAEQLKKDLSVTVARRTELRFAGVTASVELTRATLEELTADLLDRLVEITERTIATAARLRVTSFDDVLLVGGMTRMPAVARSLRERLDLDPRHHEPDLAVAKGAALFAVLKQLQPDGATRSITAESAERVADQLNMNPERVRHLARKKVTTVVPRGFGVKATDPSDPVFATNPFAARKLVWHLITANTPLPADSKPYPFAVVFDNQPMVEIEVWEQIGMVPSGELSENALVGKGYLTNLPPRPAGSPFTVTFLMSETGTLTVHAEEPESGVEVRFELRISGLSQTAVDTAREDIARHRVSG